MADEQLREYLDKRDVDATLEPAGGGTTGEEPRFVIQKHDASSLHYDLRLEVGGVLKSWAVPKGPSTDPRDKRLAMPTEDHPMDYADFEGVIPEGQYGGGTVIVWDTGTYVNVTTDREGDVKPMQRAIADGHVNVRLKGQKLQGGYALQRTQMGDDREKWLLIKVDDDAADARRRPTSTQPESVLTGRTNQDLQDEDGAP